MEKGIYTTSIQLLNDLKAKYLYFALTNKENTEEVQGLLGHYIQVVDSIIRDLHIL